MFSSKSDYFEMGRTTHFACQYDPRFSYSLYIPNRFSEEKSELFSLAIIVHGSMRNAQEYRDEFIDFSEETNTIILTPLFPGGITKPWESDSYKFVRVENEEFDTVLLKMVDEVGEHYKINTDKFLLHGYSGGGQFSHRFFYLHPDRLLGVSIGAPGNITLINEKKPWYIGIGDLEEKYNIPIRLSEMQKVPVLMVVGKNDTETWMINDEKAPYWMDEFKNSGVNRIERLRSLQENYLENNIDVEYREIENISHEAFKVTSVVKEFFRNII